MGNIFDYVSWRGDLSFDEKELNVVDSLVFSILSYENFSDILKPNERMTLEEVSRRFFEKHKEEELNKRLLMNDRSHKLLKECAKQKRYKSLTLWNYVNEVNEKLNVQFSAVTFEYKDKWKYIAFSGTDESIVGWKEDFNMLFKDKIESQKRAIEYLNEVASEKSIIKRYFKKGQVYVGGHSKGGNLAMYASAFANLSVKDRIMRVDNFDGPGLDEKTWEYIDDELLSKYNSYIPKASIFGRIFEHKETINIVESASKGLMQHFAYNWNINTDGFIHCSEVSNGSEKAIIKFNKLFEGMSNEKKEKITNDLFHVFEHLDIDRLSDLLKLNLLALIQGAKEIQELDSESRKVLIEFVKIIWDITEAFQIK